MKLDIKSLCNRQLDLDTKPTKSDDNGTKRKRNDPQVWRDILAFWILGLGCEFGYFVVISAAHDILQGFEENSNVNFVSKHFFSFLLHHSELISKKQIENNFFQI